MSGRGSPPGGLQGPPTLPLECFFDRGGILGLRQLSLRLHPSSHALCVLWETNHREKRPGSAQYFQNRLEGAMAQTSVKSGPIASWAFLDSIFDLARLSCEK